MQIYVLGPFILNEVGTDGIKKSLEVTTSLFSNPLSQRFALLRLASIVEMSADGRYVGLSLGDNDTGDGSFIHISRSKSILNFLT